MKTALIALLVVLAVACSHADMDQGASDVTGDDQIQELDSLDSELQELDDLDSELNLDSDLEDLDFAVE